MRLLVKLSVPQCSSHQLTGNGACSTGASYMNPAGEWWKLRVLMRTWRPVTSPLRVFCVAGEPRVAGGDCYRSTVSPSWVGCGVSLLSPAGAMPARMRNDVSSPVSRSPTNCHARLIPTPRSPMMR
jgi:hypothetical protein